MQCLCRTVLCLQLAFRSRTEDIWPKDLESKRGNASFCLDLHREILQEIQRLRLEHEQASQPTPEKAQQNPTLLAELRLLR